jgi:peptidoglycan/LPS O-acetylase OafA/YrhL
MGIAPTNFSTSHWLDVLRNIVLVPTLSPTEPSFPADSPMWSLFCELLANLLWFGSVRLSSRWPVVFGIVLAVAGVGTFVLGLRHHTLDYGWSGGLSVVEGCIRATFGFFLGVSVASKGKLLDEQVTALNQALLLLLASMLIACRVHLGPGTYLIHARCGCSNFRQNSSIKMPK